MEALLSYLSKDPSLRELNAGLQGGKGPAAVFSLPGCERPPVFASLLLGRTGLILLDTETEATLFYEELKSYCPQAQLFLPRDVPLVHMQAVSGEIRAQRLATLSRLSLSIPTAVVSCVGAVLERLAPPEAFVSQLRTLKRGDVAEPRALLKSLCEEGYERVDMLEGPGQCALRGDILDVFPPQGENPCRIEFFDEEIDQIRLFDAATQRSVGQVESVFLPPAYETPQPAPRIRRALKALKDAEGFEKQREDWEQGRPSLGADVLLPLLYTEKAGLLDYLPKNALLFLVEPARLFDEGRSVRDLFAASVTAMLERGEGLPAQGELLFGEGYLEKGLNSPRAAAVYSLFRTSPELTHRMRVGFDMESAPAYLGDTGELKKELLRQKRGGQALLLYAGEGAAALGEALEETVPCTVYSEDVSPALGEVRLISKALPRGFVCPALRLTVLTGAELFGKRISRVKKKKSGLKFSDLAIGDYVVHETHGVGRFVGVEQLTVQHSTRDYLLFLYKGGDKLYIPTDQLDRIQKYMGAGEDVSPQLSKLGGGDWQQKVTRAKAAAKKLAVDLAELYSKRASCRGFAFSKDTPWQKKLEESFPYEETPDQLQCIQEIKADMEAPRPMDRLLCGDVGYGKTEVAIRAAFKAIQDGKQAAILVPTTILAQQHYATLSARFGEFPVNIGCLSRFQSPKERQLIKQQLAKGEIDLVIGTHALLAKDVRFKDLGLLIIDEEHRFGVNHKEQLKALRTQVDVLTMTATPIPRTLNMAMTGVRDVSTIETPPENRFPVQTFVMEYTDSLVQAAVSRELGRGGQVFIVSNRVIGMEGTLAKLQELVPEARIAMAHGQMPEQLLEKTMLSFLNGETDVLLCSTIIESGVDIPNCNTLIVLEADKLGLAQLYQLRGRVGRSNRMAYAYLTVKANRALSEDSQKRLLAIREFTQFGAGYRLALRDLEIRGAGSLMGAEQHGHITDIGYEYYCKLIREAVQEAKGERPRQLTDAAVDAPVDAFVPKSYVNNELMRMSMYKRIAEVDSKEALEDLYEEFTDRYGTVPEPVENLLYLSLIKHLAGEAGISEVNIAPEKAVLKYAPEASIDGGSLLGVLSAYEGARLNAKEPPSVVISVKSRTVDTFVKKLPQFLLELTHCNREE